METHATYSRNPDHPALLAQIVIRMTTDSQTLVDRLRGQLRELESAAHRLRDAINTLEMETSSHAHK